MKTTNINSETTNINSETTSSYNKEGFLEKIFNILDKIMEGSTIENLINTFRNSIDNERLEKLLKKIFSEEKLSEEEVKIIESLSESDIEKLLKIIESKFTVEEGTLQYGDPKSTIENTQNQELIINLPKKPLIKIDIKSHSENGESTINLPFKIQTNSQNGEPTQLPIGIKIKSQDLESIKRLPKKILSKIREKIIKKINNNKYILINLFKEPGEDKNMIVEIIKLSIILVYIFGKEQIRNINRSLDYQESRNSLAKRRIPRVITDENKDKNKEIKKANKIMLKYLIEKIFSGEKLNKRDNADIKRLRKEEQENFYSKLIEKLVEEIFYEKSLSEEAEKELELINSEEKLKNKFHIKLSNYIIEQYLSKKTLEKDLTEMENKIKNYLPEIYINDIKEYIELIEGHKK